MLGTDLSLLLSAAQEAGRIATSFSGPRARRWEKAGDAGPVTEADLAVDTYLRETLTTARPEYGWLSEETEDSDVRLLREAVFIVDPIDGTRSFIEGASTWAISIAIARHTKVTEAVIYLPLKDKLYSAALGSGASLNGMPIQVSNQVSQPRVLGAKPNFEEHHWPNGLPPLTRHYRPSLAYRMACVGEGRFEAMLTLRPSWEWDIAAGALIIEEAGGKVSDRTGAALGFNNAKPKLNGVVASESRLHSALVFGLNADHF